MDIVDHQIIKAAQKRDETSFALLYKHSSLFVYNVVLRIAGSREDAVEITQDVYVKVYNKLPSFAFKSSFKTWLYRIAVNTSLNHIRKRKLSAVPLEDVLTDHLAYRQYSVDIQNDENQRLLDELLSRLNPELRCVIVLREVDGLSYEDIALVLKLNINTVRTRIKRAREKLALLYKRREVKDEVRL